MVEHGVVGGEDPAFDVGFGDSGELTHALESTYRDLAGAIDVNAQGLAGFDLQGFGGAAEFETLGFVNQDSQDACAVADDRIVHVDMAT